MNTSFIPFLRAISRLFDDQRAERPGTTYALTIRMSSLTLSSNKNWLAFPIYLAHLRENKLIKELTVSLCLIRQRSHSSLSRQVVLFKLAHCLSCFGAMSPVSERSVLLLSRPAIHCASPTSRLNRSPDSLANPSAPYPRATTRPSQPVPVVLESSDAHCCPRYLGQQGWILVKSNSGRRHRLQLEKLELVRLFLEVLRIPSQKQSHCSSRIRCTPQINGSGHAFTEKSHTPPAHDRPYGTAGVAAYLTPVTKSLATCPSPSDLPALSPFELALR